MDSAYSTVNHCRDFSAVLPVPKMGDHELPMHDYDNMPPSAGADGFSNYQFTFNCAASGSNSGGNSFIEPDPDAEDMRDSESLTDSVQNFPEEFGRTYHAYRAGSYAFPNDDIEIERLDLQNEIMLLLFGGRLYFAPLSKKNPPRTILDIATGTGEWAIKMGDEFPHAEVIATDLSPIQPNNVPPNVNFYVEDSSQEWDYTQKLDYIHTSVTAGCWSSFEDQIARQAFENLNPGGWFESQEFDAAIFCDDNTLDEESPVFKWYRDLQVAAEILDRPLMLTAQLKEIYERVGFVDVKERVFKVPINGWPKDERYKELGRMWERNLLQGLSGFSFHLFNRAFGRTMAQIEVALMDVRRSISDTRIHAYVNVHVVTGRKPFPGEVLRQQKWFQ